MATLSDHVWNQIRAASWSLAGAASEDELSGAVLQVVLDIVGGDEAVFNAADLDTGHRSGRSHPDVALAAELTLLLTSVLDDHPVVARLAKSADTRPVRMSDLLPFREFERTQAYELLFAPRSLRHQAVIPVDLAATRRSGSVYAVNRSGRDFDDAEVAPGERGRCHGRGHTGPDPTGRFR